jgi:hypothetical protein
MGVRHKHADVIHAYAEGEEIEYRHQISGEWIGLNEIYAAFSCGLEYRIKPKIVKQYADVAVYKLANGRYEVQLMFFGDVHIKHEGSSLVAKKPIEWEEEDA